MKMHHSPWHWVAAAAVLAVALLTLSDAHGQRTGSAATFDGRPAIAGAQSGLGAMSGPPQGGLGVQSTEDAGGGVQLPRRSPGDDRGPAVPRDPGLDRPPSPDREPPAMPGRELEPRRDRGGVEVAPRRGDGSGIEKQQRPADKAERGLRRSVERARRGIGGIDSE